MTTKARLKVLTWLLLFPLAAPAQLPGAPDPVGPVQGAQPVTAIHLETEIADPLAEIHDPTVAWIKRLEFSEGSIVSGFTLLEPGPNGFGTGVAASTHTNDPWAGPQTFTARRWHESPSWPSQPSNFCNFHDCMQVSWGGYSYVAQTLWGGIDDVAVLVVTGGEFVPGETIPEDRQYNEIALVSSADGGATFTQSKLITLSDPSAGQIDPKSIYASLHRDPQVGTVTDGKKERAIYLVWKNHNTFYSSEPVWWTTKVLFGTDGTFIQPAPPRKLDIVPHWAERVTVQSYFFDNFADDHFVDIAFAELLDEEGKPKTRPACPSEETRTVKWWVTRSPNFDGPMDWWCQVGNLPCIDRKNLLAQDERWRPCVGAGFAEKGNMWTKNDERISYTYNESFPKAWFTALTKSDEKQDGRMRVHLYEAHYDNLNGTPLQTWVLDHITQGPLDEDHYAQQQAMHKGVGWPADSPMLAYSYFVTDDGDLTHLEATTAPAPSSLLVDHWTPGTAILAPPWYVNTDVGTKHGLTAQQLCVDHSEGPCPGQPAIWPDFRFFATWPMIEEIDMELWGSAFTD